MCQGNIEQQAGLQRLLDDAREGSRTLQSQLAAERAELGKAQLAETGLKAQVQVMTINMAELQAQNDQLRQVKHFSLRTSNFTWLRFCSEAAVLHIFVIMSLHSS